MRRTCTFARSEGIARCRLPTGETVVLPVVPGILKHPDTDRLRELLARPEIARRYTREALRVAAWPILRMFPADWLRACLPDARLRPGRAAALAYLLS